VSPRERKVRLRLMLAALSLVSWSMLITGRLVQLQVVGRASFERQAARQSERTIVLDPRRGSILDRRGRELAVSVDADSIYAVPQEVHDAATTTGALGRALGLDRDARADLLAQLRRDRAFVWVKRKVDPVTAAAVRALQLDGVGFLTENRRYYPKRDLAAPALGYVGLDNTGMSGVEYGLEDLIRGRAAKVTVHVDARRRPAGHTEKPSTDGHTVVLTLDEAIQHVAERELQRAVVQTGSVAGTVVVLEPRTGEILAMASRPTFNPNRFGAYPSTHWRNRAVTDAYEPGSVFKVFTAAAAIQEKVVSPDEIIDCGGGAVEVAGVRINDHAVFHDITFRDVIAHSSDVGVIRVAQRLGRENFNRYLRQFGFGEPTGVDLPGESPGLLRPPSRWSALSLPSLSFGQEIGVTALQLAAATAAIANGGYLMRPFILLRAEDSQGRVVREGRPRVVRRVLEPETVDVLTDLMRGVVRYGTGKRAEIPGYAVAGKTGTAQKVDASGRYSMIDHVASFVGFVPASRPALVILVSLDTPRGALNEGGHVAAPLFARVAEPALRHLGVPADDPARTLWASDPPAAAVPASFQAVPPAGESEGALPAGGPMPDLRGRSAREATREAARRGLMVELKGSGVVLEQRPEPGAPVEPASGCVLTLGRPTPPAPAAGAR
jgi:cell division protein FtsI (penicillin-binding protein 3)